MNLWTLGWMNWIIEKSIFSAISEKFGEFHNRFWKLFDWTRIEFQRRIEDCWIWKKKGNRKKERWWWLRLDLTQMKLISSISLHGWGSSVSNLLMLLFVASLFWFHNFFGFDKFRDLIWVKSEMMKFYISGFFFGMWWRCMKDMLEDDEEDEENEKN